MYTSIWVQAMCILRHLCLSVFRHGTLVFDRLGALFVRSVGDRDCWASFQTPLEWYGKCILGVVCYGGFTHLTMGGEHECFKADSESFAVVW